ncbi:hypothetical protein HZI73_18185 [Vallitalea pronyensis]|uniref:Uncharacterized protein n=1 Tax=Vallitalea pronyensis TaxID=1348613 RepID=A0A8J8SI41_9FIRM|nr:DUF6188 family protein [Vallitalea pronyensis]QUI24103.1 hypothetical protein HZI73_18185 [Vallitalea pronyensis]
MYNFTLDQFIHKKVIEINDRYPLFIFEENVTLMIECSWRLRDNETIVVGCSEYNSKETHKKTHKKLLDLLKGQAIQHIECIPPVSDLLIHFSNGLYLELFSNSTEYESWTLADEKGFQLVSAPGGKVCFFE